jgi:hypothetical protein
MNQDLEKHAADKVKRALDDIYQLTDDVGEKMRIALMASSVCMGAAAAFLSAKAAQKGFEYSEKDSILQILDLLRLNADKGPEAVTAKLNQPRT